MVFSSISFLYYFLPIVLLLYFLVPNKLKNSVLLVSSLFFYFYGEPKYLILMIISIVSGYLHGLWIFYAKRSGHDKLPLLSSIVVSIGLLAFFKYSNFITENINWIFNTKIHLLNIVLPIGISFYTFQILSYTIDVYKGEAMVQKNIFSFATYVSLFPQLIAGPIVRYTTVEAELCRRTHSFADASYGISRFIIGLGKKVLIANTLGELVNVFTITGQKTVLIYWITAISFLLQVYFDFSAYSDMAIGLGRIFGFHFLENFNYPLISKSISEFWRRWHISLGTWFRDYIYIPMGGNRVGEFKYIFNITVIWLLTGLWHGAQWNFIIWGLYFAIFLILEKFYINDFIKKLPPIAGHVYMLFIVTIGFVLFNGNGINECLQNLKGMFGLLNIPISNDETLYYLKSYAFVLTIAIIGATPLAASLFKKITSLEKGMFVLDLFQPILNIFLLLLITSFLVDGSFNPFLYFRF